MRNVRISIGKEARRATISRLTHVRPYQAAWIVNVESFRREIRGDAVDKIFESQGDLTGRGAATNAGGAGEDWRAPSCRLPAAGFCLNSLAATSGFEFRATIACLLCNSLQKHQPLNQPVARLYVAWAERFGNFEIATEGAPEVVPYLCGSLKFPAFTREGEGAKMLSRVPGDIRGHGGPAQYLRVPAPGADPQRRCAIRTGSTPHLKMKEPRAAGSFTSAVSAPQSRLWIRRSLAGNHWPQA